MQGQSDLDKSQATEWDSLKDVPFCGDTLKDETDAGETENEEEEMSM